MKGARPEPYRNNLIARLQHRVAARNAGGEKVPLGFAVEQDFVARIEGAQAG